jgi:hypothetical protein
VGPIKISFDGKTLAYRAKINGQWFLVSGDEKAGPYDNVWQLTFSPDDKTLAYVTNADQRGYIIVGNEQFEALFQELGA